MRAVVLTESRTGNTRRAGELIGGALLERGHEVHVYDIDEADLDRVAAADLLFPGTWVGGIIVAGHHPGGAGSFHRFPMQWNKPAAGFVTYAFHAGSVEKRFTKLLERRGMDVIATERFRAGLLPAGVEAFVDRALAAYEARLSA